MSLKQRPRGAGVNNPRFRLTLIVFFSSVASGRGKVGVLEKGFANQLPLAASIAMSSVRPPLKVTSVFKNQYK